MPSALGTTTVCTHAHMVNTCTGYIHMHADTLIPMPTPVLLTHKHAWVKIYVGRFKVRENVTYEVTLMACL